MAFLSSLNIPLSGMTAERFRMDIIAQNIDNADNYATRPEDVYKRQMVVFGEDKCFKKVLRRKLTSNDFDPLEFTGDVYKYIQLRGVQATRVVEDETPVEPVYSPDNPLADEYGYVYHTNVNLIVEQTDSIQAEESYQACKSVYEAVQGIIQASLNLGK